MIMDTDRNSFGDLFLIYYRNTILVFPRIISAIEGIQVFLENACQCITLIFLWIQNPSGFFFSYFLGTSTWVPQEISRIIHPETGPRASSKYLGFIKGLFRKFPQDFFRNIVWMFLWDISKKNFKFLKKKSCRNLSKNSSTGCFFFRKMQSAEKNSFKD